MADLLSDRPLCSNNLLISIDLLISLLVWTNLSIQKQFFQEKGRKKIV